MFLSRLMFILVHKRAVCCRRTLRARTKAATMREPMCHWLPALFVFAVSAGAAFAQEGARKATRRSGGRGRLSSGSRLHGRQRIEALPSTRHKWGTKLTLRAGPCRVAAPRRRWPHACALTWSAPSLTAMPRGPVLKILSFAIVTGSIFASMIPHCCSARRSFSGMQRRRSWTGRKVQARRLAPFWQFQRPAL